MSRHLQDVPFLSPAIPTVRSSVLCVVKFILAMSTLRYNPNRLGIGKSDGFFEQPVQWSERPGTYDRRRSSELKRFQPAAMNATLLQIQFFYHAAEEVYTSSARHDHVDPPAAQNGYYESGTAGAGPKIQPYPTIHLRSVKQELDRKSTRLNSSPQ